MIVDGRALAEAVLARTKARTARLAHPPRVLVIATNETPATKSYLAIKQKRAGDAGCVLELREFPGSVSAEELQACIWSSDADAIIVQLPLPHDMDARAICDAIPVEKDADVLSTMARMRFEANESDALVPPVAEAVKEILASAAVDPRGKKAVVIGMGWLVGRPCATWLSHAGADVSHVTAEFGNISLLHDADIIVSGVGSSHFLTPDMLKEGAVLIDAGTSESNGKIAGDADPACADVCALFTPVPGGVGPVAVAKLFENVATLAERAINS